MFGPHVRRAALTPALTVPQGLVGYWPLDLGSLNWGTNKAYDRSGRGSDGTLTSLTSAALVSGRIGQALSLNGSTQYVSVTNTASINLGSSQAFTLAAWAKSASATNTRILLSQWNAASRNNAGLFWNDAGSGLGFLGLEFLRGSTGGCGLASNTKADGNWHHIAATWDGTSKATMFVDGRQVATRTNAPGTIANTSDNWAIGGNTSNWDIAGSVDDARIYSRALSAQEILSIYTAGLSGRA